MQQVASLMPIVRQTSLIRVPSSACLRAKAICSSVNLHIFTTCYCPLEAFIMPGSSVAERFETLGQGQLQQPNLGPACLDSDQKKTLFQAKILASALVNLQESEVIHFEF